jgi:hypothetical protein
MRGLVQTDCQAVEQRQFRSVAPTALIILRPVLHRLTPVAGEMPPLRGSNEALSRKHRKTLSLIRQTAGNMYRMYQSIKESP